MRHAITILSILIAANATSSGGPLSIRQMPPRLQQSFRGFHAGLLGLSRRHAAFADFRKKYAPDHVFRNPLIRFRSGKVDIALQIHAPGNHGWAGMRGGPTAVGGSILLADGYWLQFSVISEQRALRKDFVSCVTEAFGKRHGLPGNRSTPGRTKN
jgi:hypothetical protein